MKENKINRVPVDFFRISDVYRSCARCGEEHCVFYRLMKNGRVHLAMACPNHKPTVQYIKYEDIEGLVVVGDKKQGILRENH